MIFLYGVFSIDARGFSSQFDKMYRAKYEYIVDPYYVLQKSTDLEYLPEANRAYVRMERTVGSHEYILKRITIDAIGIVWDTLGSSRGSQKNLTYLYLLYFYKMLKFEGGDRQ